MQRKEKKNKATVTENEKRSTSKGTGKVSMLDTLLELERLRRRYEWEVEGRGLNARRRTGGAVLGA